MFFFCVPVPLSNSEWKMFAFEYFNFSFIVFISFIPMLRPLQAIHVWSYSHLPILYMRLASDSLRIHCALLSFRLKMKKKEKEKENHSKQIWFFSIGSVISSSFVVDVDVNVDVYVSIAECVCTLSVFVWFCFGFSFEFLLVNYF